MDEQNILKLCAKFGWKTKPRGDWVSIACPFAEQTHENGKDDNPSFGISVHPDSQSKYNCMACGLKNPLSMLPTALEYRKLLSEDDANSMRGLISEMERFDDGSEDDYGYLVDRAPQLSEYVMERFQKVRKSHLATRDISTTSAERFELQWDRAENRLLFPIRDVEGRLVGIRGRYLGDPTQDGVPRYKEYVELYPSRRSVKKFGVWYGAHEVIRPDKALILVEGEIDLIRLKQVLPLANVLAGIGATITKEQYRMLSVPAKGVILFFDGDMAGQNATKATLKHLKTLPEKVSAYRVKDFCGCNDVDQIIKKGGKDLLVKALQSLDKIM